MDVIKINKGDVSSSMMALKGTTSRGTASKLASACCSVQVFEHPHCDDAQLLYFEDPYVAPDDPDIEPMHKFNAKLRKLGITETIGLVRLN